MKKCLIGIGILLNVDCISAIELEKQVYSEHRYVIVEVDLAKEKLRQYWINPQTNSAFASIANLKIYHDQQQNELLFAINSGIYDVQYSPLGLYIEDGMEKVALNKVTFNQGKGNFSLLPNGVFYVDSSNQAKIVTTEQFNQLGKTIQEVAYATQSGPMLLISGKYNQRLIPKSTSVKIRSGVCVIENRVHFVITEDLVSFYEFASYFKTELNCQNALYLDGTITRLYYKGSYYGAPFWKVRPYVGIWAVSKD